MKDKMRFWNLLTFYDRTGIQKMLEEKAANGWMLEKTGSFGWIYRRMEPAKVHFAVTYFPAATAFDPAPSEKQQRFQEFCEHTGWELVASNVQMQIYCNRRENPIPIETDPMIELQNIHASVKKSFLLIYSLNFVNGLMQLGLAAQRMSWDPIQFLANTSSLMMVLFWILLLIASGTQIGLYLRWYLRAKKAAEDGQFLDTKNTAKLEWFMVFLLTAAVTVLVVSATLPGMSEMILFTLMGLVLIIVPILTLSAAMKKRGVSASNNRLVTYGLTFLLSIVLVFAATKVAISSIEENQNAQRAEAETYEYNGWTYYVYHDDIPLTIEDLMDPEYDGYSTSLVCNESSPLISCVEARQTPRRSALTKPELSYQIVDVKAKVLFDYCLSTMLKSFDHNYAYPEDNPDWEEHHPIDAAPWGADRAWQLILGGEAQERYLLCYGSRIVEIDLSWFPTEAQMTRIGQLLGSL